MQVYLQGQVDQMKSGIDSSQGDLKSTLYKIGNYDKDLRMMQAQLRQAFKDIKGVQDNLGEKIFNLEELMETRFKDADMKQSLYKEEVETQARDRDEKLGEMLRDQLRLIEIMIKDNIRASQPEFSHQIMQQVAEVNSNQRDLVNRRFSSIEEQLDSAVKDLESRLTENAQAIKLESRTRDEQDKALEGRLGHMIVGLNELVELRY